MMKGQYRQKFLILVLFVLLVSGCRRQTEENTVKEETAVPVMVYVAKPDTISQYLKLTGGIEAENEALVYSKTSEKIEKIHTGWSPIDLIELKDRGSFLVFNSEDRFAEVWANGSYDMKPLPYDYPIRAAYSPEGDIYLSYGPHQSYWPTVYIWDAKNGILTIDAEDLGYYDRRIPRQAHEMALDGDQGGTGVSISWDALVNHSAGETTLAEFFQTWEVGGEPLVAPSGS